MTFAVLIGLGLTAAASSSFAADAGKLYETYCQGCHGAGRLGGTGPVLLPESLSRLKKADAFKAIAEGLPATQMPSFKGALPDAEIQALAEWIYTEPAVKPKWEAKDIETSRIVHQEALNLPARPVFKADPSNVTLVVEHGDNHITVLDGDVMEPIHRFATRYALHGGPKFTQDGRFVYWATRDGWITKFDLWNLKVVAEVRAGINTRNLAVSSDAKYVMVANYLPHTLVALDTRDLSLIKVIPVVGKNGKTSRVSAVYDARPRASFIAALKDIPEVWEIPYDGRPVYKGMVHDHQLKEAIPETGPLPVRQIELADYLDDFYFDQDYKLILGASRTSPKGQVVHLDAGRKIADLDLPGMPHLGSGITWQYQGRPVMASPNLKEGLISVIDMKTWQTVKQIKTLGPGFFLRSHENTPYAWADVFSGPNKEVMHVIDKRTLEIVATLRPEPGKTSTHVEFDRYGKYALVSIWEQDGALIVYDAATFKEIKRLPMKRPVGKYNVWNKTRLSEGTSH
ncbi:MAG: c-type cytochrome [Hydrogenophilaceae bacterium]|nr:c-type cytochrome [Hydrogenophilaceae bacterium]